jgi:hypothetical protein
MKNQNKLILERLLSKLFKLDCSQLVNTFLNFVDGMRDKNGLAYTIKYMKCVKLHITRYICGKPLKSNSSNVSLDKDYFPTRFVFLKKLSKTNPDLVLTLLSYTRSLVPNKNETKARKVSTSTITDPYKGKEYTIPKSFIESFIAKFDLSLSKPVYSNLDHYLSLKGSPNGKASVSSMWSIASHNVRTLEYIRYLSGSYFNNLSNYYTKIVVHYSHLIDSKRNKLGKLSIVHDPELKERVIAMVDYTTQFLLKPIHNQLLNCLRKLECDRTFTQDPFHNWSSTNENYYSLDLSAATDRFPIVLQQKLLSLLYNDYKFGENWRNLLVERNYEFEDKEYRYSVGQPMGAYTSWAAFTLTHHLVVHWAAKKAGFDEFKDYIILGDDIVIKNNRVAQIYINLMTKWGVDISMQKTHVSKDTYEFAKRWIKGGKEISGLSLKGILSNIKSIHVVYMHIFNYLNRRPSLDVDLLVLIGELYNKLLIGKRRKTSNTIKRELYDFHHSIRYSFNLLTYEEIRNYLINKFGKIDEFVVWPEDLIPLKLKEILSHGMVSHSLSLSKEISSQYLSVQKLESYGKDLVKLWPMIHGFKNHVERLETLINSFIDNNLSLVELVSDFRLQNLDGMLAKRLDSQSLIFMDKLWKSSFAEYKKELQKEKDSLEKEPEVQQSLVSHIWGMARATTPSVTYKTEYVGLKRWQDKFQEEIESLNENLFWYLKEEVVSESQQSLESKIHNMFIECIKDNKVPNFDDIR